MTRFGLKKLYRWFLFAGLLCTAPSLWAQDQTAPEVESATITGGIAYQPERGNDDKLRDPFKSPFEIEQEEREQRRLGNVQVDETENRLPYSIGELELRGIYYEPRSGYRAIFKVGDDYKWWPAGTKFQDADLVNITDGAVIFKQYAAGDDIQVRDVVRELHRGEE